MGLVTCEDGGLQKDAAEESLRGIHFPLCNMVRLVPEILIWGFASFPVGYLQTPPAFPPGVKMLVSPSVRGTVFGVLRLSGPTI